MLLQTDLELRPLSTASFFYPDLQANYFSLYVGGGEGLVWWTRLRLTQAYLKGQA